MAKKNKHKYHYQKEAPSAFTKIMTVVSVLLVAGLIILVTSLNASVKSSTATTANVSNNGYTINKDLELITGAKPTELDKAKMTDVEFTQDAVTVTAFVDYACPHCQTVDEATAPVTEQALADGEVDRYVIIPVAYQPLPYAKLGQQAAMCVADKQPDLFYQTHLTLMKEGPNNPTYSALMPILEKEVGTITDETKRCIKNSGFGKYGEWLGEKAMEGGFNPIKDEGITGTPSIFLNMMKYSGNPDATAYQAELDEVLAGGVPLDPETPVAETEEQ